MNTAKQSLVVSPSFLAAAADLSKDVKAALIKTLMLLAQDVRHPSLQCKKVQGSHAAVYECRVDQKVRLIYDTKEGKIRCWYVGAHDVALRFATKYTSKDEIVVDDIEVQDIPQDIRPVIGFLSGEGGETEFNLIEWHDLTKRLRV